MTTLPGDVWTLIAATCPGVCRTLRGVDVWRNTLTQELFEQDVLHSAVTLWEILKCGSGMFSIIAQENGAAVQYLYNNNGKLERNLRGVKTYVIGKNLRGSYKEVCNSTTSLSGKYDPDLWMLSTASGVFDIASTYLVYRARCALVGKSSLLSSMITQRWHQQTCSSLADTASLPCFHTASLWLTLGTHLTHLFQHNLVPLNKTGRAVVFETLRAPAICVGRGNDVRLPGKRTSTRIVSQRAAIELIISCL